MKIFLLSIVGLFLYATPIHSAFSEPLTKTQDNITLEVSHTLAKGKNLVKCALTNGSDFPICTGCLNYKMVFYVKLTDIKGKELLPYEEWAQEHAQKSSRRYQHPRSHMFFDVKPGESVNFEFSIEDAYPLEALAKGAKLEISWETMYFGADKDFDGKPYRFPPDWKTSVTVPLADIGLGAEVGEEAVTPKLAQIRKASGNRNSDQEIPTSAEADRRPRLWPIIAALVFLLLALVAWLAGRRRSRFKAAG